MQVGRGSEWGPIQVRGIWECVQYQRTSDRFPYTYRSGTKGQEKLALLSNTKDFYIQRSEWYQSCIDTDLVGLLTISIF